MAANINTTPQLTASAAGADKVKREKTTEDFIYAWKEHSVLWDAQNPLYRDKEERSKGLQSLAEKTSLTEDAVKKKINSLRTYYSRELVNLQAASKRDEIYDSKWCHFKSMAFLRHIVVPRKPAPSYENGSEGSPCEEVAPSFLEYPDSGSAHSYDATVEYNHQQNHDFERKEHVHYNNHHEIKRPAPNKDNNTERMQTRKRKPEPIIERESTREETATYSNNEPAYVILNEQRSNKNRVLEADEIFGQNVTASLRAMPDTRTKEYFKLKVQELIYQVQFGDTIPTIRSHHHHGNTAS